MEGTRRILEALVVVADMRPVVKRGLVKRQPQRQRQLGLRLLSTKRGRLLLG